LRCRRNLPNPASRFDAVQRGTLGCSFRGFLKLFEFGPYLAESQFSTGVRHLVGRRMLFSHSVAALLIQNLSDLFAQDLGAGRD